MVGGGEEIIRAFVAIHQKMLVDNKSLSVPYSLPVFAAKNLHAPPCHRASEVQK